MKIVYMGTPDFSVGALEALLEAGHEITAVVTQPDRPKGRGSSGKQGQEAQYSPVKRCALSHGIPVFQPERIKRPEAVERLREFPADIYVVAAFGQILSREILEIPRFGCVNIHASLLPRYRGASPIQQAVIDGEEKTGVTIMQMNEGMDTGDILYQKEIKLAPKETGESLFARLAGLGAEAIVEALPLLEAGKLIPAAQDEDRATYVKMITKARGRIDWQQSAEVIERLVRGLNSWPSAYTFRNGRQIKVWDADVVSVLPEETCAPPGTVIRVEQDAVTVMTGKDALRIMELQPEGKRRMPTRDFLLGYRIECGESFQE